MKQYTDLTDIILEKGNKRKDRTGTGTIGIFGAQLRFDLDDGFPLLTTKKVFIRGIIEELLWFLAGETNNNLLATKGVHIWDNWATENGSLGPVYGEQWRSWKGKVISENGGTHTRKKIDQIQVLIDNLKTNPFSRRHIVSAWNVEELPDESISPQENVKNGSMALAPCHCLFQFYVREMSLSDRVYNWNTHNPENELDLSLSDSETTSILNKRNYPKYRLDCQLYQR